MEKEEVLELLKKQLWMQKIISGCLAVLVVVLLIGGGIPGQSYEPDGGCDGGCCR